MKSGNQSTNTTAHPLHIDRDHATTQLKALAYNRGDAVYIRAFLPKEDPRYGPGTGRKADKLNWEQVERWQAEGYGIYLVVNGGGHKDEDVTSCRALFCEFDDRPIEDQIFFWRDLGLPEPSLQIATRKSVHTYWIFKEQVGVDQWRKLQAALLAYTGSDPALKNPSRVMRLAGSHHMKPGSEPLRCEIIHQSNNRYSFEELCSAIPVPSAEAVEPQLPLTPEQKPQSYPNGAAPQYQCYDEITVPVPEAVPMEVCLSKESRNLLAAGVSEGERNTNGAKLARDLIGTANHLLAIGQQFDGGPRQLLDEYAARCTPPLPAKEVDAIWKSAEKDRPGPSCKPDGVDACIKGWYWNQHVKPNQPTGINGRSGRGFSSGSSDGGNGKPPMVAVSLRERILEILQRYDSNSMRDAALMDLAASVGRNFREVEQLAKVLQMETELSEDAVAAAQSLKQLLKSRRTSLAAHDYFEGWFADLLQLTADAMPTAVEFLITTLLPVAAACIGTSSRVVVKAQSGYVQPLVIWAAIVGQSGALKTPAQKAIINPLIKLETLYYSEYKEALKAYNEEISYRRSHPEEFDREPEPIPPVRQRLVTKDSTLEKLQRIHGDNPRGLLYYRDELAGGGKSRNQYRGGFGADYEAELDQFNGGEIIYDRGNKEVFLPNSCICRTGGYQWEVAAQMMDEQGDFSGMNARWLMDAAKAPKAYIDLLSPDADLDTGLSAALENLYKRLRLIPQQDYLLTHEAKVLFQAFQHESVDLAEAEPAPGLQVVYPKNQSYVARLALLLHIVNATLRGKTPEPVISGDTMRQAIALAGYYMWQYRMIYKHNHPDSGLEGLGLKAHRYALKLGQVTASAVKRGVAAFRKVITGTIRQVLESLAASGWGRTEGEGADLVYIPNTEPGKSVNHPVDAVDAKLRKTSTAVTSPPKGLETPVDEIDEIDLVPPLVEEPQKVNRNGSASTSGAAETSGENHQFINLESQPTEGQGIELVDACAQSHHQLSTEFVPTRNDSDSPPIGNSIEPEIFVDDGTPPRTCQELAALIVQCQTWVELVQLVEQDTKKLLRAAKAVTPEQRRGLVERLAAHLCDCPKDLDTLAWVPAKLRDRALSMLSFTIQRIGGANHLDVCIERVTGCRFVSVHLVNSSRHQRWEFLTPVGQTLVMLSSDDVEAIAPLDNGAGIGSTS